MRFFTSIYTLLLLYTISALLFWGFSLARQSRIIYDIERASLTEKVDSLREPETYARKLGELNRRLDSRRKQFTGEGSVLLIILLTGAAVVYTSLQRRVRLQRQQNNFMLAVTHELKTPIAAIKLSLQTLLRPQLTDAQRSQLLIRSIQESDRLAELCNNMLITSQIEGRQYKKLTEHIDLSDIVEHAADIYTARYPDRITTSIQTGCSVKGDTLLLQLALNNLLENAVKYTPADTPIEVRLVKAQGGMILQVADNGTGIPDREKRRIFTKFYRIGDETTRQTKGTGLGLYLTRHIVKQHKGRISIRDNVPQGAVFQIFLPC